jgi:nicotinamide-nucleotide amidase
MAGEDDGPRLAALFPDSAAVGDVLLARHWRVAVAESCTGGLLGAVLTAVPGASAYVSGGVIAYGNAAKEGLLGVDGGLITTHGAVSQQVAVAMAAGAAERLGAEVGVGVTGVAGPGSEEGGKPAGLVFVAVVSPGDVRVRRLDGDHGREGNRGRAVQRALRMLVELG